MNLRLGQKGWRFKLPVMVGAFYFLCSTPFLLDVLTPSIHEGNLYSFLFVIVNIPVIYLFAGIVEGVSGYLFANPTLWKSNMILIAIAWVFWVLLAFLTGVIVDMIKSTQSKRST